MNENKKLTRIMGLDVGKKRIGSAITDELHIMSSPYHNFPISGSLDQAIKSILIKCEENNVGTIIIGMPFELDGSVGEQAVFTQKFILRLVKNIDPELQFPIESLVVNKMIELTRFHLFLVDERFTSVQAERQIKAPKLKSKSRREVKDNITACILIDTFLQISSLSKR